jgi:hypothetical protein
MCQALFSYGDPRMEMGTHFFNPRMETGIPHFHMGMCQSPFPYGGPRMEMYLAAEFFGDVMAPGA